MSITELPKVLYRANGTTLAIGIVYSLDRESWFVGYVDRQQEAWMEAVTVIGEDLNSCIEALAGKIIGTKKYFIKPVDDPSITYDHTEFITPQEESEQ